MADDAAITVEEYTRTFRRTRTPLLTTLRNMVMGIAPHTIEQMEKDGKLLLSADETKMVRVQANDSLAPLKATEYFHSSTDSSINGRGYLDAVINGRAPLTQPHDNSL